MITSRRDYLLRMIDEVGRLLARVIFKRKAGADQEALESVVVGCERLFGRPADQIFALNPEQQVAMLLDDTPPEFARDKLLLYAALNAEAGRIYQRLARPALARASFTQALRLTVKARVRFPTDNLPDYAPKTQDLLAALSGEPLDPETAEMVKSSTTNPPHPTTEAD